jgi:hypothetical protein
LHVPELTEGGVPPQVWLPHTVPDARWRHELEVVPWPLQVPSFPQLLLVSTKQSPSGFVPAATGLHKPFVLLVFALEQAMQSPVQALSQQKPSTQWPLAHSASDPPHVAPWDFFALQAAPEQ